MYMFIFIPFLSWMVGIDKVEIIHDSYLFSLYHVSDSFLGSGNIAERKHAKSLTFWN